MRRLIRNVSWLIAAVLLSVLAWVAFAALARTMRETQTVERLAMGQGRWIQTADAKVYVQEWGDPSAPAMVLTHGTGAWSGTWFSLPDSLAAAGRVQSFGRGRARRWMTPPVPGFTTTLLLPSPLPID